MKRKINLVAILFVLIAAFCILKIVPRKNYELSRVEKIEKVFASTGNQSSNRTTLQDTPEEIAMIGTKTPVRSVDSDSAAPIEELDPGLEFFEYIAAVPGAYDLAWDIRETLEKNPNAIDLSDITFGAERNFELRDDYLERMIKDPDLRGKWIDLMEILAAVEG